MNKIESFVNKQELPSSPLEAKNWNQRQTYSPFFCHVLSDLGTQRGLLSASQYRWALETILALAILEEEADDFSQILEESKRNQAITDRTGLIAELALTKGKTSAEIGQSILGRIEEFKTVYFKDEAQSTTLAFLL